MKTLLRSAMLGQTIISQTIVVAVLVLAFCHVGRAQTPSAAITISPSGTVSSAYIAVSITASNFSSVSNVSILVTDNAGHQYTQQVTSGSNPSFQTNYVTSGLILSPATSYNGTITIQAFVTGTGGAGEPPPAASAQSNIVQTTVQVGYILGPNNSCKVTAPTTVAPVHLANGSGSFPLNADYKFDFNRYDTFGTYQPVVSLSLATTFGHGSDYGPPYTPNHTFNLLSQTGDVVYDTGINDSVSYVYTPQPPNTPITFYDQAVGRFPVGGSAIEDDTQPATAEYP